MTESEAIKQATLDIYDSLPQEKSKRIQCLPERDKIVELNYKFFGYVASKTFINNSSVTYEDKLQSCISHFLECWWWYKWQGDETHKGYRSDLSFAVFFKPRLGENIERELNEVKYSVRRSLCMEAGEKLGKHWGQVRYEDLSKITLPPDKMNSLKAIFGTMYWADLESHALFIEAEKKTSSILDEYTDKYDSVEDFLIHEMIANEAPISDKEMLEMSITYSIPYEVLKDTYPKALDKLYKMLKEKQDIAEEYQS